MSLMWNRICVRLSYIREQKTTPTEIRGLSVFPIPQTEIAFETLSFVVDKIGYSVDDDDRIVSS